MSHQKKFDWKKVITIISNPQTARNELIKYALSVPQTRKNVYYIDTKNKKDKFTSMLADMFFAAAAEKQAGVVSEMLKYHLVDINIQEAEMRDTALHVALAHQDKLTASVLKNAGIDLQLADVAGSTGEELYDSAFKTDDLSDLDKLCAHLSAKDMTPAQFKALVKKDYYVQPYRYVTCKEDHNAAAADIFSDGFVEVYGKNFFNDLMVAGLDQNQPHLVDYLLRAKLVDANAIVLGYPKTCLGKVWGIHAQPITHVAVLNDNMVGLSMLQDHGACLSLPDGSGLSAYQLAKKMDKMGELWQKKIAKRKSGFYTNEVFKTTGRAEAVKSIMEDERVSLDIDGHKLEIPVSLQEEPIFKRILTGEDVYVDAWKELNERLENGVKMSDVVFLSELAQLRYLNKPTKEAETLTLANWAAVMAAQNECPAILNHIVDCQLGDSDFISQTEMDIYPQIHSKALASGGGLIETQNPYVLAYAREAHIKER